MWIPWPSVVLVVVAVRTSRDDPRRFALGRSRCTCGARSRRGAHDGISAKLYSGGGEGVVHSSVRASHGSAPASSPALRLETTLKMNTRIDSAIVNAPDGRDQVPEVPAHSSRIRIDPPRHALQPEDVHRPERQVEADEHQPEVDLPSLSDNIRPNTWATSSRCPAKSPKIAPPNST